jgi:hypothetical protein
MKQKNEYEETCKELYPTFSQFEIAEADHTPQEPLSDALSQDSTLPAPARKRKYAPDLEGN